MCIIRLTNFFFFFRKDWQLKPAAAHCMIYLYVVLYIITVGPPTSVYPEHNGNNNSNDNDNDKYNNNTNPGCA